MFGTSCAFCTRTRFLLHVLVVFIHNLNIHFYPLLSLSSFWNSCNANIGVFNVPDVPDPVLILLLLSFYLLWCNYFDLKIYFMTVMKPNNLFFYQKLRGYNEYIERGYNEHSERFLVLFNLHKLTK